MEQRGCQVEMHPIGTKWSTSNSGWRQTADWRPNHGVQNHKERRLSHTKKERDPQARISFECLSLPD